MKILQLLIPQPHCFIDALGSFVGGVLTNRSNEGQANAANATSMLMAKRQRKFNAREAQKTRDWSRQMSNTAVRRRMLDLEKAGINPILAGKFDATTPASAMATSSAGMGQQAVMKDPITPAINTALEAQRTDADVNLKNANTALTETKNALSKALLPGAEALATITQQLSNLATAASNLLGSDVGEYQDKLEEIGDYAGEWFEKAKQQGKSIQETLLEVEDKLKGKYKESLDYFKYMYDRHKSTHQGIGVGKPLTIEITGSDYEE